MIPHFFLLTDRLEHQASVFHAPTFLGKELFHQNPRLHCYLGLVLEHVGLAFHILL